MKEKILEIIKLKPKHYSRLIQKDSKLKQWVVDNSIITSDKFVDMIYSSITQESNMCEYGNIKTVNRISEGWACCGPASNCACTRQNISKNVAAAKSQLTGSEKKLINLKRESTLEKQYGYKFNFQRPEIKQQLSKPKISEDSFNKLNSKTWLDSEYNDKQRSLTDIAEELQVYYGTVGEYCRKYDFAIRKRTNYSKEENKICLILEKYGIEYVRNTWEILNTKEIDIYIPSKKLGIEINGLYWHSYNPYCTHTPVLENKFRHAEKLKLAEQKGIQLIQITDFEINNSLDLVESLIMTKIGKSKRIYARCCDIRLVSKTEEQAFLSENHFQGFSGSAKALGLYHDNELCMIMTWGKPRMSKSADIELIRLCSKKGNVVVGGVEKLFKKSLEEYKNLKIISYCDLSKFTGSVYKKLGFKAQGTANPGYIWTDGNLIISRHKCQHKNLSTWLASYNRDKSESENMFLAKYRRYWDCGQARWIYNGNI